MDDKDRELNAWRELGEEMGRVISLMPSETFADWFPDWFGPRLFDLQVKAAPALRGEASPQDWQSIETAPKDGRWIWVKRVPEGKYSRLSATESAFRWDALHVAWFAGTGWWPQFPIGWTHWRQMRDQPVEIAAPALRGEASPPEICICAAIRLDNGVVLRGHRHDDCFKTAMNYGYKEYITQAKQGFVTSRNRFVNRNEGWRLMAATGEHSAHTGLAFAGQSDGVLFSEDLYFNDNAEAMAARVPVVSEEPKS